jgi:hypothetical protein
MTQTPDPASRYAPPRADVADLAVPDPLLSARPRSVVWACVLMLVSMVVAFASLLPFIDPPMPGEPAAMTAMVWGLTLVSLAVDLWLLRCVWQRRNWARWVIVAIVLASATQYMFLIADDWTRAPLVAWMGIASTTLGAVAAALLLTGASSRWFKAGSKV